MECQKCSQEIDTKSFRVSTYLKCKSCGASYLSIPQVENPKSIGIFYVGAIFWVVGSASLKTLHEQYIDSFPAIVTLLVYSAIVYIPLYKYQPIPKPPKFELIEDYEQPFLKQDIFMFIGIILITILLSLVLFNV